MTAPAVPTIHQAMDDTAAKIIADMQAEVGAAEAQTPPAPTDAPPTESKDAPPDVAGATWDEGAQRWRGADGKFVTETPAAEPDAAEATTEPASDGEAAPDENAEAAAPLAIPLVTDREPMTKFEAVIGGQKVEGLPDLTVTYTVRGQQVTEPIDKLVRRAQSGHYNEQREAEYDAIRAREAEAAQRLADMEQQMAAIDAQVAQMFADEQAYLAARDRFAAEQSPEARARRAEERARALEAEQTRMAAQAQGERFYSERIQPALSLITDALPTVTADEVQAKMLLAVQPYVARYGYVPPSAHPLIEQYVMDELAPWARALHDARSERGGAAPSPKASASKPVATSAPQPPARRTTARALSPVAAAPKAPATQAQPKAKPVAPPTNVDDATAWAAQQALAEVMGTSAA